MNDEPSSANDLSIPVVEEQLEVGRRVVETGRRLRVRKHVEEAPTEVTGTCITERFDIERVPIGRVITEPIGVRRDGDDVVVVPVIEERLVTRKELVLVEEIRLTRRREASESTEQVSLRRERVVVERFDPQTGQWLSQDEA